jgi:D-erythronate 2-dehydrogenase
VVEAFIKASEIPGVALGAGRTVLLTGIPVSADEMWNAVKGRATGKVRFEPDPLIEAIMDRVPKATFSGRAARLGFSHSRDIQEIVREYQETTVAHHG